MINKQVSYCLLQYQANCVSIKKKRSLLLAKKLLFFLVLLLLGGLLFWSLLAKSPNAFNKTIDFGGWIFLGFVGVVLGIHLAFNIARFLRVISDFEVCKLPSLTINGNPLNSTGNEDASIVVQDVGAVGGIGGSFTVGLAQGKTFFGLCYELRKEHAKEIAEFMAENLGYRIDYREAVFFPLFKLH